MAELWERQEYDTEASFKAFTVYLTQTGRRSLQKAADTLYLKQGANRTQLTKWSSEKIWQERVSAYDDHIAELDRADYEEKRLQIRKIRQNIVEGLQGLAGKVMAENKDKLDPMTLSALTAGIARILEQSRKEFNDLPTERKEVTGQDGKDLVIKVVYDDSLPSDS